MALALFMCGEWHAVSAALTGSEETELVYRELLDGYEMVSEHNSLTDQVLQVINMGKTFSEIESEAMALPANERAALARDLIESLDANVPEECEQAWETEAERRYAAYGKGEIGFHSAEHVIAELKNQYK